MKKKGSNDECYTPLKWITAIQRVFKGRIDFDPCSCKEAQATVQAKDYFTKEIDGLKYEWPETENLFMNPPYSRTLCDGFVYKFLDHYQQGKVGSAILLINNGSASTRRGHALLDDCLAMATPLGRIQFDGQGDKNRYEQTFLLFTKSAEVFGRFVTTFRDASCKIMVNPNLYIELARSMH